MAQYKVTAPPRVETEEKVEAPASDPGLKDEVRESTTLEKVQEVFRPVKRVLKKKKKKGS